MSTTFYPIRDGRTVFDTPAEINLHNAGARALLGLLRLPADDAGVVTLAEARRAYIFAQNTFAKKVGAHEVPAYDDGGPGTGRARMVSLGIDEAYLQDRLTRFGALLEAAGRDGCQEIGWS